MTKKQKAEIDDRFKASRREVFDLLLDIEKAAHKTAKAVTTNKDIDRALERGFERLVELSNRSSAILKKIMRPFNAPTND